jgi:hypothetical protein
MELYEMSPMSPAFESYWTFIFFSIPYSYLFAYGTWDDDGIFGNLFSGGEV